MTLSAIASNFGKKLQGAIKDADWATVDRCRERLVKLFVDAHQAADVSALTEIERHLVGGHALMVHLHGASVTPDETARGWMMSAEARVVATAKLRSPAPTSDLDQVARSKRDAILIALDLDGSGGNRKQMTNRDLARACSAAEATVARIMPILRAEGLVTSVQRGAKRLNELTNAGRDEVYQLRQQSKNSGQINTENLEKFQMSEVASRHYSNLHHYILPDMKIEIVKDDDKAHNVDSNLLLSFLELNVEVEHSHITDKKDNNEISKLKDLILADLLH